MKKAGENPSEQPKFQHEASNAASHQATTDENYPITKISQLLNDSITQLPQPRHHRNPTVIGNSDVSTSLKYCL